MIVPPADWLQGFYSCYFLIPKGDGGVRAILDLGSLNGHLKCIPFHMLTLKHVIYSMRQHGWIATIKTCSFTFQCQPNTVSEVCL